MNPVFRTIRSPVLAAAILSATMAVFTPVQAEDWSQWRGPNRDGISDEKVVPWSGKPKVLWRAQLGQGYAAVSVADGLAYASGNAGDRDTLYCFDTKSGKEVWKYSYPCPAGSYEGTRASPAISEGKVYHLSREAQLFCLDAKSGKELWTKDLKKEFGAFQSKYNWGFACSPVIIGEVLVLDVGTVLKLKKGTGEMIWKTQPVQPGFSTPALFNLDGKEYLTSYNAEGLTILQYADGKKVASFPWKTSYEVNAATPIVSGNEIFIGSGYNHGGAMMKFENGKLSPVWKSAKTRNHFTTSMLHKGYLYGFDESDLVCTDWKSGKEHWRQGGLGKGSLMLAGDNLLIISEKGDLVLAEAAPGGYKQLARSKVLDVKGGDVCWTMPVLSGGKVYCRTHKGAMVCVELGK